MSHIVAIVGRPNVGKSTLYNRLVGERQAIIDNVSGVTRDRIYDFCDWNGREFTVVDTGGFVHGSDDVFEAAIRRQVHIAIDEAEVIIFLADVTTGITDLDAEIADLLRKSDKKVLMVVNKVDNNTRALAANEFWSLGFEDTFFMSSMTGSGSGEVLDAVVDLLPPVVEKDPSEEEMIKIAIVGQPNVGKSSLTNALLGEERNIVTEVAGTTRDAIHTKYSKFDREFLLIDTAGIRKKSRVHEDLEFYSVIRAVKAIEEADVCILMLDAKDGIESQDMSIINLIIRRKKGIVVVVNKWDLLEKETNTAKDYTERIHRKLAPFNDVPIVFTSVKEKQRIFKAMETALAVAENRKQKIKTSTLNEFLQDAIAKVPPPAQKGKFVKIKYVTQLPLYYPAFAFFCNHPKYVKESYRHYLENRLREQFNFNGVPLSIFFRDK